MGLPSPRTTQGKIFPFDSYEEVFQKNVKQVVDIKEKFHISNGNVIKYDLLVDFELLIGIIYFFHKNG